MKKTSLLILFAGISLSACASDPYQAIYDGIKSQNDSNKTPQERELTPTPSYDAYKKERDTKIGQ